MLDDEDLADLPTYRERGWHADPRSAAAHQALIDLHLARSAECEVASRPENGPVKNKDALASEAIEAAVGVLDTVAGWAVAHTVGLGLAGIEPTRYVPPSVRHEPEYVARQADLAQHDHEARGGSYGAVAEATPEEQRRAARNLIGLLAASRTMGPVLRPLYEALMALEFGERLPILAPAGAWQKREYRLMMAQLSAVGFVAYRKGLGVKKEAARDEVADAFGQAAHTMRTWEDRLKKNALVGRYEVQRVIAAAKNSASWVIATRKSDLRAIQNPHRAEGAEATYGTAALQRAGAEYQAILRGKV